MRFELTRDRRKGLFKAPALNEEKEEEEGLFRANAVNEEEEGGMRKEGTGAECAKVQSEDN